MRAQNRTEIASLLERHGLSPNRRLGQHFLADANITRKIVGVAEVKEGDRVVEIGAGTGTLTSALAATGAEVVAYEVDHGLGRVLEDVLSEAAVEIRIADITTVDLGRELVGGPWKMVANLPYNVGTPLVLDSMRRHMNIELFVVLVQREVAERFVARPGTREYGLPSVVAQVYTRPEVAFRVPPQVFFPPPSVESAVVVMRRIPAPAGAERAVAIAQAAFGQRRKMLRRSLDALLDEPVRALEEAGIDPTRRAEELSPAQYLELARLAP